MQTLFETIYECKRELYDVMLVSCWWDDKDDDADNVDKDVMIIVI